jgi:anti-sigma B factor antagonist
LYTRPQKKRLLVNLIISRCSEGWVRLFCREADMTEIIEDGNQTLVIVHQDMVASMTGELKNELKPLVQVGIKELVIDLTYVEMIDSTGLGLFADTYHSLSKVGGKLKVINASKQICYLIKAVGLDRRFEVREAKTQ